ncbi:hypothetical protein D1872_258550 [compost metagenome]
MRISAGSSSGGQALRQANFAAIPSRLQQPTILIIEESAHINGELYETRLRIRYSGPHVGHYKNHIEICTADVQMK